MPPQVGLIMNRGLARRGLTDALVATGQVERVFPLPSGAVAGAAAGGGPPAPGTPTTPAVDVVVAEVETFLGRGTGLVRRISRLYPGAAIVLLVDRTSPIDVWAAFSRGVRGYVLSTAPVAQVVEAVLGVYQGGVYIILPGVMSDQEAWDLAAPLPFPGLKLTQAESQVLALLSHGKSASEIAAALRVSPSTVRSHLSNLCRKTGCPNQRYLLLAALATRWMPPEDSPGQGPS